MIDLLKESVDKFNSFRQENPEIKIDFQGVDLQGMNLQNVDLQGANLQNVDLRYTDLQNAKLENADLRCTSLRYADIQRANLRYAKLSDADLRGADLSHTILLRADIRDADLRYVDLHNADLSHADIRGAVLDFSCIPLSCKTTGIIVDDRFIAQQLFYLTRQNTKYCSGGVQEAIEHIKDMAVSDLFCEYRNDISRL